MTTYNSYEEAKIANPECAIFEYLRNFGTDKEILDLFDIQSREMKECNPADHCMTVEKFLADGYEFELGDVYLDDEGYVVNIDVEGHTWNEPDKYDDIRYVLRAAALETKEPKRTKVEYVKCEYGDKVSNIVMDFENNAPLYKSVNDEYWTIDELDDLFQIILNDCYIYRRIETPIEWWEDAASILPEGIKLSMDNNDGYLNISLNDGIAAVGMTRDQWCDFARILLEQGE